VGLAQRAGVYVERDGGTGGTNLRVSHLVAERSDAAVRFDLERVRWDGDFQSGDCADGERFDQRLRDRLDPTVAGHKRLYRTVGETAQPRVTRRVAAPTLARQQLAWSVTPVQRADRDHRGYRHRRNSETGPSRM